MWSATITKNSPRRKDWLKIFGSETIPILGPIPQKASGPNGPAEEYFLKVDLSKLSCEQWARLINHITEKFGLSEDDVVKDLRTAGMPILAQDLIVPIDLKFFS